MSFVQKALRPSTRVAASWVKAPGLRARSRTLATAVNHENFPIGPANGEQATFTLRDGPVFHGTAFGANTNISGEAVFTTSLVGYPESLTDPSYRGQILVFTQPLIGNYGVPGMARDQFGLLKHFESPNIQASGVVVTDVAEKYSHWAAVESLSSWMAREGVPGITGVDTRAIVTYLREQGSSLARITVGSSYDQDQDEGFTDPEQIHLVRQVSTKQPYHISNPNGNVHIAMIDGGHKEGITRCLLSRGASVTVLPWDYPVHKIASHFDGVFLSNGPGDPTHCSEMSRNLRKLIDQYDIPIFGICLGHQILSIAAGAKTIKLKYGNRAHNIPVLDLTTGRCLITSQNHGYAIDTSTIPSDWKEYFVNLNDGSNEGIIHKTRPIFGTQFHPEAAGGPSDSAYLFDAYLEAVVKHKAKLGRANDRPSPLLVDLLAKERVGVTPTTGMQAIERARREREGAPTAGSAKIHKAVRA